MTVQYPRYHYLDQIRAHMMFLGIVFHSIVPYLQMDDRLPWSFHEPVSHPGLMVLFVIIHVFRMPVFFIVAGFFCALMIQRWGVRHLAMDRGKRILLPLLVLVVPMHWLGREIIDYAAQMVGVPEGRERAFDLFTVNYLWFLYFLSIYYAVVLVAARLLPANIREVLVQFARSRSLFQLALMCGGVITLAIWQLNVIFMPAPLKWNPNLAMLLYYAAFFLLGMALYGHRSLVECPPGRLPVLWALTLVTAIGCCVLLPVRDWYTGTADRLLDSLWGVVFAVSIMASSLLVISMYQRFMARESRVGRYIADSAYWVYLVHFPLTLIMPLWIYSWPIPPTLKFGLVVVAVTALSLLSYHWCVRYTWIGAWLNGKKPLRKQAQAELMLSR